MVTLEPGNGQSNIRVLLTLRKDSIPDVALEAKVLWRAGDRGEEQALLIRVSGAQRSQCEEPVRDSSSPSLMRCDSTILGHTSQKRLKVRYPCLGTSSLQALDSLAYPTSRVKWQLRNCHYSGFRGPHSCFSIQTL